MTLLALTLGFCLQPIPYKQFDQYISQKKVDKITLKNKNHSWEVNLKCNQLQYKLGQGWRDFVIAHNLAVDDACMFELVSGSDSPVTFKVKIYKN